MSKICPQCNSEFEDNQCFCSNCGSKLIDNFNISTPHLNLGDANAISGGIKIDQSKAVTSYDTHYHSTIVERVKSESEVRLDAINQVRTKAEETMAERGRIDSVAISELRKLSLQLGISDEHFKSIIKEIRSNANGRKNGLSTANARYLLQAQQAVQTNDMDAFSNLTPRLEAMTAISQDDDVQYLYYLSLSILYPIKSMEVYEQQTDENYWRLFWAIVSYIRTGKYDQADITLAQFDPLRFDKSEEDQNLLEAYNKIMREEKDGAQDFLDEMLGEPSNQIKPMLRAIENLLYDEEAENLEVRFYSERLMTKSDSIITTKKEEEKKAEDKKKIITSENTEIAPVASKKTPEIKETITKEKPKETTSTKTSENAEEVYIEASKATGPKKVMLLQKAADVGSVEAMYDLGDCYLDGEGVDKNIPLAIKWLQKAADLGYAVAQTALGGVYYKGIEGLDQSYVLAEKYLLMAANNNQPDAQGALAGLYYEMKNFDKALLWAKKAAISENSLGCYYLGFLYKEGLSVEKNLNEAEKWLKKSANGGDVDAQNVLGNLYSEEEEGRSIEEAFKYYKMAAEQGHIVAMANLAACYHRGYGVDVNLQEALKWYQKAKENGFDNEENQIDDLIEECQTSLSSPHIEVLDIKVETDGSKSIFLHCLFKPHGFRSYNDLNELDTLTFDYKLSINGKVIKKTGGIDKGDYVKESIIELKEYELGLKTNKDNIMDYSLEISYFPIKNILKENYDDVIVLANYENMQATIYYEFNFFSKNVIKIK